MNDCILIKPDISHKNEIKAFRQEMLGAGSSFAGTGPLERMESVEDWLEFNQKCEKIETLPENLVTSDQYVYLRKTDQKIVGMIQFRHTLNEYLKEFGGHIGYSVLPSERKKGFAKKMLAECLIHCKNYGLDKVLLTCSPSNEGSKRTILSNGGVYERTVHYEPEDKYFERYWIKL